MTARLLTYRRVEQISLFTFSVLEASQRESGFSTQTSWGLCDVYLEGDLHPTWIFVKLGSGLSNQGLVWKADSTQPPSLPSLSVIPVSRRFLSATGRIWLSYNVVKELIEVVPLGSQITIATSANADLGGGVVFQVPGESESHF